MAAVCSSASVDPVSMPHLNCRASPHNMNAASVLGQAEITACSPPARRGWRTLSSIQDWGVEEGGAHAVSHAIIFAYSKPSQLEKMPSDYLS